MKLPATTAALSGFTDVHKLTASAITSLTSGGTVKIAEIPAGAHITNCIVSKTRAHAGTSTDLVLDVGIIDGDVDGFIDNVSLVDLTSSAAGNGYLFTGGVVQAATTLNPTGNDNSVTYTAVTPGTAGNSITVAYVAPVTASAALGVVVTGTDIVVNLATDAGTAQVETGTVVGLIEAAGAGNAQCIVTAAGMTNSPKTVTFAVANDDTAAQVATKARAALVADANVGHATTGFFTVTGASEDIILTAKTVAANDATMNIRIDNDTSVGLTNAPTSADTTAGAAIAVSSTAAEVITAVNDEPTAAALVTAAASGTVTGVVAAVAETALTGGESASGSRNSYANETASTMEIGAKPTFTGTVTGGEYLICMTILNPNVLRAV